MSKAQSQLAIEGEGAVIIHIDEIERAVDAYVKERDKFVSSSKTLQVRAEELRAAMHAHENELSKRADGTLVYNYDDQVVTCSKGKEKVKVKAVGDDGAED